jgi:hypothetical protein
MNNCSLINNGGHFYGYLLTRENSGTFTIKNCHIDFISFFSSSTYYAPFSFFYFDINSYSTPFSIFKQCQSDNI